MSVEESKAIARRWNEELINKGNVNIVDELADANYVNHADGTDRDGFKQYWETVVAAFSNGSITIEDLIAEGGKVVVRWTMQGTHTGEYLGVPATGEQIQTTGISIYRITNGKVVEAGLRQTDLARCSSSVLSRQWDRMGHKPFSCS